MVNNASLRHIYTYIIDDEHTTKGGSEVRQRKAYESLLLKGKKNNPGEQVPGLYKKGKTHDFKNR